MSKACQNCGEYANGLAFCGNLCQREFESRQHLRDVLACWCAGAPAVEHREIRDRAVAFLSDKAEPRGQSNG